MYQNIEDHHSWLQNADMLPWKVLQAYEKCTFSPQDLDIKCNTAKRKLIEPTWEINSKKWQILRETKCRFFHHSEMHNKMKYYIMHSRAEALMWNHQGDSFYTAYCCKMKFQSTKYQNINDIWSSEVSKKTVDKLNHFIVFILIKI